ncbi:hypothetical protein DL766_002764 [Monosporascus sp. MC13-8B]|nr:hypothetical protein DL766_002764 [Monosporascus sp. MC13-8B]
MDPAGRNDRPRRASASMRPAAAESSTAQKQPRSRARAAPKRKTKRKSAQTTNDDDSEDWWEIKDIIGERLHRGVVHYLVQWEGTDPRTGQPYEPGWEPSKNVTEAAISAWREKKKENNTARLQDTNARQDAPDDSAVESTQDSNPVQPANLKRGRRGGQEASGEEVLHDGGIAEGAIPKRRHTGPYPHPPLTGRQDTPEGSEATSGSSNTGVLIGNQEQGRGQREARIAVVLPFNPSLDRSEYQLVLSSPASQQSSQQSSQSRPSWLQTRRQTTQHQTPSQRVIPDSQDFSGTSTLQTQNSITQPDPSVLSQIAKEAVARSQVSENRSATQSTQATANITSHQPDHQATGLTHDQDLLTIATQAETTPSAGQSQQSLPWQFLSGNSSQNSIGDGNRDDLAFLTQVPHECDVAAPTSQPSTKSAGASSEPNLNAKISTTQNSVPAIHVSSHTNSQAAQIVSQLSAHPPNLLDHSQESFALYDEQGVVPAAATGQPEEQLNSQGSSQALSELNGNTRNPSSASRIQELDSQAELRSIPQSQITAEKQVDRIRAHVSPAGQPSSPSLGRQNELSSTVPPPVSRRGLFERQSQPSTGMENPEALQPRMSAKEKLRLLRERHFAALDFGAPGQSSDAPIGSGTAPLPADETETQPPTELNVPVGTAVDFSVPAPPPDDLTILPFGGPAEALQDKQSPVPETTQVSDGNQHADSLPLHMSSAHMAYDASHEEPPATLDPSNLTLSIEGRDLSPSIPTDDALAESAGPEDFIPSVDFSKQSDDELPQQSSGHLPYIPSGVNEHLITLPFFASTSGREQYNDIIRENQDSITSYNSAFLVSPYQKPNQAVIPAMDQMFSRLFDFCDFPPFLETAVELGPEVVTKHVVGTNPKFCFVDEFLLHLNRLGSTKKILILARPGQLLDLLSNVVQTRGHRLIRSGQETSSIMTDRSSLTVVVHSTSEDSSSLPSDADAVIAFDHTYRRDLLPPFDEANPPLILLLTNTNSIQHISMRVSENMEPLERKNYLMHALVKAMRYIEEPDYTLRKPPEIAEMFAQYLEVPDNDDFYWEPQELPEDIFEGLPEIRSQIQPSQPSLEPFTAPQAPGSRKRSHDEPEESASKRPRMSQAHVASCVGHISDSVRKLLGDDITDGPGTVSVSIARLEALSAKIARLTAELKESGERENEFRHLSDRSKEEVDGYTASINTIQTKFMEALKDRGIFEADCAEATEKANTLTSVLESVRKENATLKETNTELRKKLSEATESLLNSSIPEVSKLAQLEKDLEEARAKAQHLEKRVTLAQGDLEYTKNAYQQASHSATQLRAENRELEARLEALARRADDNVARVNELQSRQEAAELARLLAEQRGITRDREARLGQLHEELRLARAGRRETRQSSVPRSPRMTAALGGGSSSASVLSPRNHNHHPTTPSSVARAATSSRAASPASATGAQPPLGVFESGGGGVVSGMPFFNRHAHLRD